MWLAEGVFSSVYLIQGLEASVNNFCLNFDNLLMLILLTILSTKNELTINNKCTIFNYSIRSIGQIELTNNFFSQNFRD